MKNNYIIDSCSFIEINKTNPIDIFPSLWKRLADLAKSGALISHEEVFKEIFQQDDSITKWAKENRKMFKKHSSKQAKIVQEILNKFPSLIKIDRDYDADPWLIALARELKEGSQETLLKIKRVIVTEEKMKGNKVKIPFVCEKYGIECIDRIEMFREEKWSF